MRPLPSSPPAPHDEDHLRRSLGNRHIQLIALGGAIGTGLFMGSGRSIGLAGPSIIFVYMIVGCVAFFVMRAMGELLLSNLEYKSFADFATDLLGHWAGFFVGWTYWFCWVVACMAEVVAVAEYAQFWFPSLPQWISAMTCALALLALNLVAVKAFGETEFWFAMIKIVAIIALVLVGLYMVFTGFRSPTGTVASFAHLWDDGGMFAKGGMGFLAGFQIAVFSMAGIEIVGVAAAETRDPRKTLPRAINSIPIRLLMFYVLALIVLMAVTPWRQLVPDGSPFVQLFVFAGLPAAAAVINFVVLTAAASAANSGVFSTSRMLYGLAEDGHAPGFFQHLSRRAVPARGLYFSGACMLGGVALLYAAPGLTDVFMLVAVVATIAFMFVWIMIFCSYIAYRRKRPQLHAASHYKMPGGSVMCWLGLIFFAFILVLLLFDDDMRNGMLIMPFWFIVLTVGYIFFARPRHLAASGRN
ncbi:MAG: D-serine/D-alanine/glycine transporter [Burkholderiaceae bacterium]|jgi:D-serine/D-alanine/glycine transporter|nr:D-serine/D-alanine/glycine transporter [Burkholderiaceae bacterium]